MSSVSDILIAKVIEDIRMQDATSKVELFHSDLDTPLELFRAGTHVINCSDIVRQVSLSSLSYISESEYLECINRSLIEDTMTATEFEEYQQQQLSSIIESEDNIFRRPETTTTKSGRVSRRPNRIDA